MVIIDYDRVDRAAPPRAVKPATSILPAEKIKIILGGELGEESSGSQKVRYERMSRLFVARHVDTEDAR